MSLGLVFVSRMLLHPLYNDKATITFDDPDSLGFNLDDIYKSDNINLDNRHHISSQHGVGVDFTLESRHFALGSSISVIFGECYRSVQINANGDVNVDDENIEDFESQYEISRFSIITDFSFLPSGILLPPYFPVRIYGGIGVFASMIADTVEFYVTP